MLQSAEYGEIKQDYDRISRTHFPGSYFYPDQMSFANSDALFATGDLAAAIGREYEGQCEILCFDSHPSWEIVQARFIELRELL
jgi:glycine/D-amino acid oxidase-like deaminating enzyme